MTRGDLRWLAKKAARRLVTAASRPTAAQRTGAPLVRVLTYHRFQSRRRDPFALSPAEFRAQVAMIAASGRAISLDQFLAFLAGATMPGPSRDRLLLTIDDGHASTLEVAAPTLHRHGVPAVAFVTTGRIGTRSHDPERFLDADEIRSLADFGVAVGSHAADHRSLGGAIDEAHLARQIAGSKDALQTLLNREITAFAYPFGTRADHSPQSRAAIASADYRVAFTSRHGPIHAASDPLVLPRIKIEGGDPASVFEAALDGGLDPWAVVDDLLSRYQANDPPSRSASNLEF